QAAQVGAQRRRQLMAKDGAKLLRAPQVLVVGRTAHEEGQPGPTERERITVQHGHLLALPRLYLRRAPTVHARAFPRMARRSTFSSSTPASSRASNRRTSCRARA